MEESITPEGRALKGKEAMLAAHGSAPEPRTPYEHAVRDFVHAEIWTRPGLDLRARFLIAIAGTASTNDEANCRAYLAQALTSSSLSPLELREAALQLVVYSGWPIGGLVDRLITEELRDRGISEPECLPLQTGTTTEQRRIALGQGNFEHIARMPAPPPFSPYIEAGVLKFVMGEVWMRPGLDERARRIITLVGAGFSGSDTPMRVHAYSAMASKNLTKDEMLEFILHFSVYGGWPRGSIFQRAVLEQAARVEKGLPFEV